MSTSKYFRRHRHTSSPKESQAAKKEGPQEQFFSGQTSRGFFKATDTVIATQPHMVFQKKENGINENKANSPSAIQATGAGGAVGDIVQRELATPLPATPSPPQADLTPVQITNAINFNNARFNRQVTNMIQDIVGAPQTGRFDETTIRLIALLQEQYALRKDGLIGQDTFYWLDREMELENLDTDTANMIWSLQTPQGNVVPVYVNIGGNHFIQGHYFVSAMFPMRNGAGDWQYRQEIKGNAWGQKPGFARANLNHFFTQLPFGRLAPAWHEDGNTAWAGINYGHRNQPGRLSNPVNAYFDLNGAMDQANGPIYRGEDAPKVTDAAIATGDTLTLDLEFKGSVYRRNNATGTLVHVQTKTWTVNGSIVVP